MLAITVDILDDEKVVAALKKMNSYEAPKALRLALRDTAKKAPPRLSKEIRKEYTLTAKRVKRDIDIQAREYGYKYLIKTSYRPITVANYKMRPNPWRRMPGGGVGFSIYKGRKEFVKNGFVGSGAQGVNLPFVRITRDRYPIKPIYGPSIGAITTGDSLFGDSIMRRVEKELTDALRAGINRRFGAFLRGYGRVTG